MHRTNTLIYGGTFDPPHLGHLELALNVQKTFCFDSFIFLPCKTPVLKKPAVATNEQRLEMLRIALTEHQKLFQIDKREMNRDSPSYMVDTLKSFRIELGDLAPITLLLGMDAFLQFHHWHAWEEILTLSHLLIIDRPNHAAESLAKPLERLFNTHQTHNKRELLQTPFGKIMQFDAGTYPHTSTDIRKKLQTGKSCDGLLPQLVYQYIKKQTLYT